MSLIRSARAFALLASTLVAFLLLTVAGGSAARAEGVTVHGRIEDDARRPLGGATVRLLPVLGAYRSGELHLAGAFPPPPAAEARTAADGSFRIEAPRPGHWRLVASASGRADRQVTLSPLVEEVWLEPAALPAAAPLEVRVVGPDGKPVAGTRVRGENAELRWRPAAWGPVPSLLVTDETGRAVMTRAAGERFDVVAAADGLAVAESKGVAGPTVTLRAQRGARRAVLVTTPAGEPAAGVLVATDGQRLPLGRTGAGGRLVVAFGGDQRVGLHLEDGQGASARLTLEPLPTGQEPAPQRVRLVAPRQLAGRVIDATTRRPIAGALVWVAGAEGGAALADGNGGYALSGVAGGSATPALRAAAAGYFVALVRLAPTGAAPTLALDPAGAVVGSVTDASGRPLAGVEVTASAVQGMRAFMRAPRFDTPPPRATTDERGRFRLAALDPRERHQVAFRRAGYAPLRKEVTVPVGPPAELHVVLPAGASASGVVVDAAGEPIAGASVGVVRQEEGEGRMRMRFGLGGGEQRPDAEASSDRGGRFTLANLAPGRYTLTASASGHASTTQPGVEVAADAGSVDLGRIELPSGVPIAGRAVNTRGEPVADAEVFAFTGERTMLPAMRFLLAEQEPAATTAADGSFVIADRRPGERVDVVVRRAGYAVERAAGVIAPTEEPLLLTLRAASNLRGRVVDPRGEPVAEARVMVMVDRGGGGFAFRGTGGMASSGADGRFAVEDVEPGTVRLVVSADGYLPLERGGVEVPAGADVEGIELALQPGAVVEGVVTTPEGGPAIGAVVSVVEEEGGMFGGFGRSGAMTDGDGRYRLGGVEPGRRAVEARLDGYERGVAELEVVRGDNRLDLRLGGGREVSGRVAGPQGEPVAGAQVRLAAPGTWWSGHATTTDDAGAFTVEGVPDGTYEAVASHADHAEGKTTVTVAGEPVAGVVIELPAGGVVVGALRGLDPAELALTRVRAVAEGRWREGEVSRDGRYRVSGLAAGGWSVAAEVERSGRQARGHVELAPGQAEAVLDLDFSAGLVLSGVIRHQGRPVDGAMVLLMGEDVAGMGNVLSDYQGRYRIENLKAGNYGLEVFDLQRGLRHRTALTLEEDLELDVDLRSARITGRVLEATSDDPIAGARLALEPLGEDTSRGFRFRGSGVETDDRGAFIVTAVGDGNWRLVATKSGYAQGETIVELAGEAVEGVELRLQPTQGVVLRVGRTAGSPPAQVHAAVLDAAGRVVSGGTYPTGEGGTVRLSTVPAGTWEVLVREEGSGVARVAVQSPGPPVTVLLAPQASLEVVVPDLAEEESIATVTLHGADGTPLRHLLWGGQVVSEQDVVRGRTTLRSLPPGVWTVEVTAADGRRWRAGAVTEAGATATVELH